MEVNPITEIEERYPIDFGGYFFVYPFVVIKEIENIDIEEAKKVNYCQKS